VAREVGFSNWPKLIAHADGLSLTQRQELRILATHGELPASKVLGHLKMRYEPLPYLGDLMSGGSV
jgi:hypothetical protein